MIDLVRERVSVALMTRKAADVSTAVKRLDVTVVPAGFVGFVTRRESVAERETKSDN